VGDQSFDEACERYVAWLDRRVLAAARGDEFDRLEVPPAETLWLGRLASEEDVKNNPLGDRAERLDPCAIGVRVRPASDPPWGLHVRASVRAWKKESHPADVDRSRPWVRLAPVEVDVDIDVPAGVGEVARARGEFERLFAELGVEGLSAEIRVEREEWHGEPELVIQLVNTSPDRAPNLGDTHLYEASLTLSGIATKPFQLEALPDSFRYDRDVTAFGVNVGVAPTADGALSTTDTVVVDTTRPHYWNSPAEPPDLTFERLSEDPLPELRRLVSALREYYDSHWSEPALADRASVRSWDDPLRAEAARAATEVSDELDRLAGGIGLLEEHPELLRAFRLMNSAMRHAARDRGYDSWRPFQVGFLLQAMRFLIDATTDPDVVDTVWFATGGGKTETYLGLLVTAALHDRLTGKTTGVTAWSRFPLRMLSLQQTQRFADAMAGAELVRRQEELPGDPFSLGFFVGSTGGTPNRILKDPKDDQPSPDDPHMPARYQVLTICPFCRGRSVSMRFDRRSWRLSHECSNADCPWPERDLPFFIVDDEIYRFLPTVVIGTLDKAASLGMQAAMRGLVGPPLGLCSEAGHGFTYAPRGAFPHGCLVPDCPGTTGGLPMSRARFAPTLRLQDELHLLRDSLGAVDSHYESLLDHLQHALDAPRAKIVASSATLTGYDRQVEVLYRRGGRVFPQQGPSAGESFWTRPSTHLLRRFVAVAPRGLTLEFVSDRTLSVLQESVRRLLDEDDKRVVCAAAGIEVEHAEALLDAYGTDVLYGSTLYDVEAAQRSLDSNATVRPLNSEQLTGQTAFDDVRRILDQLENPPEAFEDRIHVVAASSMLSHGVDVSRLNVMAMLGLPLSTAEFIQTTARVGRSRPGLVFVMHKMGRERDAQAFRTFPQFVRHGDRLVEPIPITRRSRRVLRLTMPGIFEARRLLLMEPQAAGQRLTTVDRLRSFVAGAGLTPPGEAEVIAQLLGFDGPVDELLREEIRSWLATWFTNLDDPARTTRWPNELGATTPMTSLRDVEASAPIHL